MLGTRMLSQKTAPVRKRLLRFESLESRQYLAQLIPSGDGEWTRRISDLGTAVAGWPSGNTEYFSRLGGGVQEDSTRARDWEANYGYRALGSVTNNNGFTFEGDFSYQLTSTILVAPRGPSEQVGDDVLLDVAMNMKVSGKHLDGSLRLSTEVINNQSGTILALSRSRTFSAEATPLDEIAQRAHRQWVKIGSVLTVRITASVDAAVTIMPDDPPFTEGAFESSVDVDLEVSNSFKPVLNATAGNTASGTSPNFLMQDTGDLADTVRMPDVRLSIVWGALDPEFADPVDPRLRVVWNVKVHYTPDESYPTGAKAVPGFEKVYQTFASTLLRPQWPAVRGGEFDVDAVLTVFGKEFNLSSESTTGLSNMMILNKNPTKAQLQGALRTGQSPPPTWPSGTAYSYHIVLQQIAYKESRYQQFYSSGRFSGHPLWNRTPKADGSVGDNGHGLMQITPGDASTINPKNVWDWRANMRAGVFKLNDSLAIARGTALRASYPTTLYNSSQFKAALKVFNDQRALEGKERIEHSKVTVPQWNAVQRIRAAIRMYNGVGTPSGGPVDSIGRRLLHEYELKVTTEGRLSLTVDELQLTARATWVPLPVSRRYVNGVPIGDPTYVGSVLAVTDYLP